MIKLIRKKGRLEYAEIWRDEDEIIEHHGRIGEPGVTTVRTVTEDATFEEISKVFVQNFEEKGYSHLTDDELKEVAAQFRVDGFGTSKNLEKRHAIEDLLDDALGWTGNGHCDGGDVGNDAMTIFCFVVDAEAATRTIVATLKEFEAIGEFVIAMAIDDTYVPLYPPGAEFNP